MSAWVRIMDVTTPYAALPEIADRLAADSIAEFSQQLDDDDTLTCTERAALLLASVPLIRTETLNGLTTGWLRLQAEAADGTTH